MNETNLQIEESEILVDMNMVVDMRFTIIEHESAFDTIVDNLTGEEYVVVSSQSKKLLNLLNDFEYKKSEIK